MQNLRFNHDKYKTICCVPLRSVYSMGCDTSVSELHFQNLVHPVTNQVTKQELVSDKWNSEGRQDALANHSMFFLDVCIS